MSWIKLKSAGSNILFNILTIANSDDGNEVTLKGTHRSLEGKNQTFIW